MVREIDQERSSSPNNRLDLATSNISVGLFPDGKSVAVSGSYEPGTITALAANRFVRIWDCSTLEEQDAFEASQGIISLAVSSNGFLAAGCGQGDVVIWICSSGAVHRKWHVDSPGITALGFSHDGTTILCGNEKGRIDLKQTEGEGHWSVQEAHGGIVHSVAFNPKYRDICASVGADGFARLWDTRTGEAKREFIVGKGCGLTQVLFANDGHTLAVGSQFLGIRLWDLDDKKDKPLTTMKTPTTSLLYSPDGKTLFTGGNDGLIKVWDSSTLQQRCTLKGHQTTVVGLAMTSDGTTLVSCSWDKTVRFWRAATPDEVESSQWWRDVMKDRR
jgi:WD40 repeat protein